MYSMHQDMQADDSVVGQRWKTGNFSGAEQVNSMID